jgi:methyl-accepting chemotaxis protein
VNKSDEERAAVDKAVSLANEIRKKNCGWQNVFFAQPDFNAALNTKEKRESFAKWLSEFHDEFVQVISLNEKNVSQVRSQVEKLDQQGEDLLQRVKLDHKVTVLTQLVVLLNRTVSDPIAKVVSKLLIDFLDKEKGKIANASHDELKSISDKFQHNLLDNFKEGPEHLSSKLFDCVKHAIEGRIKEIVENSSRIADKLEDSYPQFAENVRQKSHSLCQELQAKVDRLNEASKNTELEQAIKVFDDTNCAADKVGTDLQVYQKVLKQKGCLYMNPFL